MKKEEKEKIEANSQKFRALACKLIEDSAVELVALGVCENMAIARHEAAVGLGMVGYQYASQMRETMNSQELLVVINNKKAFDRKVERRERIRMDPNIN